MLTVHHLDNSRSHRILWLLEELEVPYEIKKYRRTRQQLAPKELLTVNPLGKSPVITDGDVVLAESGAIVEYIVARYGKDKAQPPESGYLDNLYFTHYAEGSLMPLLVQKYIFTLVPKNSPIVLRPIMNMVFGQLDRRIVQPELNKHRRFLEAHLTKMGTGWFAGGKHLTSADYMMSFPLEGWVSADPGSIGPKATAYVKRIQQRPAYKRAVSKGGDYAYAKL